MKMSAFSRQSRRRLRIQEEFQSTNPPGRVGVGGRLNIIAGAVAAPPGRLYTYRDIIKCTLKLYIMLVKAVCGEFANYNMVITVQTSVCDFVFTTGSMVIDEK